MDRILIIMKKNNGHQGIICPFTEAFFHNMQTCLLVYTYNRSQVSVYRTIGPLVNVNVMKIKLRYIKSCKKPPDAKVTVRFIYPSLTLMQDSYIPMFPEW